MAPGADETALEESLADPTMFERVFKARLAEVYGYLARRVGPSLADELASETFAKAFARRDQFDPSRGSVRAWLFGIATNELRHERRRELRQLRAYAREAALTRPGDSTTSAGGAGGAATGGDIGGIASAGDRLDVASALARLDRKSRDVVWLIGGLGFSYEETAFALHIPVGTVRSKYSRSRARLRAAEADRSPASDTKR